MFEAIMRRPVSFFDDESHNAGLLTSQLAEDSLVMHKAFGEIIATQVQFICCLVIGVVFSFNACWKVTLVVLACFPLLIVSAIMRSRVQTGIQ